MEQRLKRSTASTQAAYETLCWAGRQFQRLATAKDIPNYQKICSYIHYRKLPRGFVPYREDDPTGITKAIQQNWYDTKSIKQRTRGIMEGIQYLITHTQDQNPIPASPTRQPVITITATRTDGRCFIATLSAVHGAHTLLNWLISNRKVKWIDDNTIIIDNVVTVTTSILPDGLTGVLEHTFTPKELNWPLPTDYMRCSHMLFSNPITPIEPTITKPAITKQAVTTKPTKPDGLIDLPTLLADTDITPKEARVALRKLNTPKPEHGRWEFTFTDAPNIKATIIKQVTKMRSK